MNAFFVSDAVHGVRKALFQRATERIYPYATYNGKIEVMKDYWHRCGELSDDETMKAIKLVRVRVSVKIPRKTIERTLRGSYENRGFMDETCSLFETFFTYIIDRDEWGEGYNFSRKYNLGKFYLTLCTPPSYEAQDLDEMRKECWMFNFKTAGEARTFNGDCGRIVDMIRTAVFKNNSADVISESNKLLALIRTHASHASALIASTENVKTESQRTPRRQIGVHRILDRVQTELFFLHLVIEEEIANGFYEA